MNLLNLESANEKCRIQAMLFDKKLLKKLVMNTRDPAIDIPFSENKTTQLKGQHPYSCSFD